MTDDLDVKIAIQNGDVAALRLSSIGSLAGQRAYSLGKQQLRCAHASFSCSTVFCERAKSCHSLRPFWMPVPPLTSQGGQARDAAHRRRQPRS